VFLCCAIVVAAIAGYQQNAGAVSQPRALITETISETELVTLAGNTRPEATAANDRGPLADSFPLEHLWLQLRRSPEREQALERYIDQLSDRNSPNFHHWLTAKQFGERYGLAQEDLAAITGWLGSHGFTVNLVYPSRVLIDFSGTAGQVREAFHTEIHNLEAKGEQHIANMSDPRIPAALAPAVVGVVSLNNFMPRPMNKPRGNYTAGDGYYLVVPADLATIYNLNPLFAAGYSGQGQTIVVVEDSDVYSTSDWSTFRTKLGLASAYPDGSLTQVHPKPGTGGTCKDPGHNGDDAEAAIDVEWASATAPNAAIELASCADTTTNFGGFIALQNILSNGGPVPAIVSISYGDSEPSLGAAANSYINGLYQDAVTAGVSVFVSAGDQGAASTDYDASNATHGITVSGFTSTPYNVSVGGTDFGDTYAGTNSTYWSSTNGATDGSALSYIPEIPWNDSCASELIADYVGYSQTYGLSGFCNSSTGDAFLTTVAGSGGPSGCASGTASKSGVVSGSCKGYPKPSWQSGLIGNPSDSVRDIPDVSLFAANGVWSHYYVVCYSDRSNGGISCSGAPGTWAGFGGTSVSSPIMAGIQSLVNQYSGGNQGYPNSTYYSLAKTEYGASGSSSCNSMLGNAVGSSCIFYDVTEGDMDVPCKGIDCYDDPSGTYGVLSTSSSAYEPAYGTNAGWDFPTGIGTVNAYNLVKAFGGSPTSVDAKLEISPKSGVKFGKSTVVDTVSKAKKVTIKNGSSKKSAITVSISGESADAPFAVSSECITSLEPGKSCKVSVTFSPTNTMEQTGTLIINDNETGAPQMIPLSGTGKEPRA
jgi:subtilase family serine protease